MNGLFPQNSAKAQSHSRLITKSSTKLFFWVKNYNVLHAQMQLKHM